jgi:deoxyribodipyrimidine photolyase
MKGVKMAKQQQDRLKPGDRVEWNTSQGRIYLDARDPDSYSNVAWLFGQDDRPWGERPIFGEVRYMSASELERKKIDIDTYVQKIGALTGTSE